MTTPQNASPSLARKMLPKLVISLLLGALFAWLVSRGGVPLVPSRHALSHLKWWAIPGYLSVLLFSTFFRASRWRFLIAPVKKVALPTVIGLNWIGFFAIFVLPLRIGEIARPALSKMREGIAVSAGFGTIAVERVVDGLVTGLCVVWAIFALPHLETHDKIARAVPYYGVLAVTVFAGAFIGLFLFLWQHAFAVRLVGWTFGLVSKKLAATVASKIDQVAAGIRSISDPKLAAGFLTETVIYWGSNAAGMWLLAWGVGLHMSFGQSVAVMGILAIGVLLPAGPGMFGTFQVAVSSALKLYFAESIVGSEGAAYVFLLYACQALFICVSGILPLYVMHISFGEIFSPDSSSSPATAE